MFKVVLHDSEYSSNINVHSILGVSTFCDNVNKLHKMSPRLVHPISSYLANDIVVSGRGHLFSCNGLLSSSEFMPSYWLNILKADPSIIENESKLPIKDIEDLTIVFMGHGPRVYGHFLIEMLPRLIIAKESLATLGIYNYKILVNENASEWLKSYLKLFGFDEDNVVTYQPLRERVRLKNAVIPTFPSKDGFYGSFSRIIFDKILKLLNLDGPVLENEQKDFVYLTRSGFSNEYSQTRSFDSESDVVSVMAASGFKIVKPHELTFLKQVEVFRNAKLIIGEAGSALHNSVFSSSKIVVGSIGFRNMIQASLCSFKEQHISYMGTKDLKLDDNSLKVEVSLHDIEIWVQKLVTCALNN